MAGKLAGWQARQILLQGCFIECKIVRSPMISYRSLLYSTTVLYDYIDILRINVLKCINFNISR